MFGDFSISRNTKLRVRDGNEGIFDDMILLFFIQVHICSLLEINNKLSIIVYLCTSIHLNKSYTYYHFQKLLLFFSGKVANLRRHRSPFQTKK